MLRYDKGEAQLLCDDRLEPVVLHNQEALLCQGNGYMGLRAAFEEEYAFQKRGAFLAGLYNRAMPNEAVELPNCADMLAMRLVLDGEEFNMLAGQTTGFSRGLDTRTGELVRNLEWRSPKGRRYSLEFRRFVSLACLHLAASRVCVTALDNDGGLVLETGIDGTQTNTGSQHFLEGEKRVYDKSVLYARFTTCESSVLVSAACCVAQNGAALPGDFLNRRRGLVGRYSLPLEKGKPCVFEKLMLYHTGRDELDLDAEDFAKDALATPLAKGYTALLEESKAAWDEYWQAAEIQIEGSERVQRIVNAALYHMRIMAPMHDGRCSIGAKGLSGEGYKGHIFWDTEVFMLPFFIYTFPEAARRLLGYRYTRLGAARQNAAAKGYRGALFPWESADSGAEETPEFAAINIKTGKPTPILSGKKEIHITSDIAFMAMEYYHASGDTAWMLAEGCELVLSCAQFWQSRAVKTVRGYEIQDVIGPDEYTESIDNNTYTNRMAQLTLEYAAECAALLAQSPGDEARVDRACGYRQALEGMREVAGRLYFAPEQDGVIPQDDSFLQKPSIDLAKYKATAGSQAILLDYTREQVIDMQILKQADVAMLFLLRPEDYDTGTIRHNIQYYEARTIHDSSLSKCVYGITAMDAGLDEMADAFFYSALDIDFGGRPQSGDGIHAASLFGIWNLLARGVCGARLGADGRLAVNGHLPNGITDVRCRLRVRGTLYEIHVTPEGAKITALS